MHLTEMPETWEENWTNPLPATASMQRREFGEAVR